MTEEETGGERGREEEILGDERREETGEKRQEETGE